MRYVLDSCVGIKWLLDEVDSDIALSVRDDFCNGVHDLVSPDVLPIEVTHALSRAERQGRITKAEGMILFQDMLSVLPNLHSYLPLLPRAYDISAQERVGVYDCLYVALAESEGIELVTADDRLVRNLGPKYPFIIPLSALP